jgi:hypothetical protein
MDPDDLDSGSLSAGSSMGTAAKIQRAMERIAAGKSIMFDNGAVFHILCHASIVVRHELIRKLHARRRRCDAGGAHTRQHEPITCFVFAGNEPKTPNISFANLTLFSDPAQASGVSPFLIQPMHPPCRPATLRLKLLFPLARQIRSLPPRAICNRLGPWQLTVARQQLRTTRMFHHPHFTTAFLYPFFHLLVSRHTCYALSTKTPNPLFPPSATALPA